MIGLCTKIIDVCMKQAEKGVLFAKKNKFEKSSEIFNGFLKKTRTDEQF